MEPYDLTNHPGVQYNERFHNAKSPKRKTPFDYTHYICPTCEKMEFLFGLHQHCHYCQECGQKLDWTKIENEQYTIWEER